MNSIMSVGAGLLAVLAVVIKLVQSRRSLTPNVRYLCGAIGFVGLSVSLVAPVSLSWVSTWEPMPNLGRLVANILAIVAAVCVHGLLAHLVHESARARRVVLGQAVVGLVAAVAMTVLLVIADVPYHPEFLATFVDRPPVAAYVTVFALYIGWATSAFGWFLRRYIAQTGRRWLRAGLRTIQAGCVASAGWAVSKIAAAALAVSGRPPGLLSPVGGACAAACVALIAVGATMPVWGPWVFAPVTRLRAKHQARKLGPLWQRLADAVPQITLPVGGFAPNAQFALYRRVVEIRDAQLVLRPYVHPQAATWAHESAEAAGLGDQETHQVVEAACLASALEAHAAAHEHQPEPDESTAPYRGVASDPHTEARWLIQVSRALDASPVVADIRSRTTTDLPATPRPTDP